MSGVRRMGLHLIVCNLHQEGAANYNMWLAPEMQDA